MRKEFCCRFTVLERRTFRKCWLLSLTSFAAFMAAVGCASNSNDLVKGHHISHDTNVFGGIDRDLTFDGVVYSVGWKARVGGSTVKECFRAGETKDSWNTMITFQAHPNAKVVKDVFGPYFKAREQLLVLPPKTTLKESGNRSDVMLELFLALPGKKSYIEFALSRFIQTDTGVYMVVYSHKFPSSASGRQKIDVTPVMENRNKWIRELYEMPIGSLKERF